MEDKAFSPSYDLAPPPLIPPSTVRKLFLILSLHVCRRSAYWRERLGVGGGGGAKSYDSKKAR